MQRLVILGGGESGVGTAILGSKLKFEVFVSDNGKIAEKYKNVLKDFEINWEEETHTEALILNADVVMKSPGIPDHVPLVKKIKNNGIPVISEIEFAARYTQATIVGITGSNGKTTTTMLAGHIAKQAGINVGVAGNIGDSFAKVVALDDKALYVLEISSFQLDGIVDLKPHIAVITNITPDHLDRYEYDFEKYIAAKFRIAMNQDANDYLIYDQDDPVVTKWLNNNPVKSKLLPFSIKEEIIQGAYTNNNEIIVNIDQEQVKMSTETFALQGKHNTKNAMAAATIAKLLGIRKETIREALKNFQGAEHRLEKVLKIQNVQYINDSKATNVNATFYALDSMKVPTIWIVGGVDKGNDYTPLLPLVRAKVKAIICLGIDNSGIMDAFGNIADLMVETDTMAKAVKMAYKIAEKGEAVLLSPACASFDLFKNYEDRGNQFKKEVRNL